MSENTFACWSCAAPLVRKPGPGRNPRFCDDSCRYRFHNPPGPPEVVAERRRAGARRTPEAVRKSRAQDAASARWADHEKVPRKKRPSVRAPRPCPFCGDVVPMTKAQHTCGKPDCRLARNAERMREGGWPKAHRAQRWATEVEQFSPLEVFGRDGWVCGICREPVDQELRWPDPMSASLDHVEPLSLGGAHMPENTRCTHLVCNVIRGNHST